jgi:hypothetical protein
MARKKPKQKPSSRTDSHIQQETVPQELKRHGRWNLSNVLDTLFVAVLVLLQWGVRQFFRQFPLEGEDAMWRDAFQWVYPLGRSSQLQLTLFLTSLSV